MKNVFICPCNQIQLYMLSCAKCLKYPIYLRQYTMYLPVISPTVPVIKLEMMSGRINIFSILIRMSPGNAITMTMSGWIGEATRSNIPATAPKITPEVQGGV